MRLVWLAAAWGIAAAVAEPSAEPEKAAAGTEPRALRPEFNEHRDVVFRRSIVAVAGVVRSTDAGEERSTGFFVGDRGYLVTVLPPEAEDATLSVIYGDPDSRRFPATRLAFDPYTGLALLAVPELPAVGSLETSARGEVAPGDYVYTVAELDGGRSRCIVGRVAGREKLLGGETLAASVWRVHLDSADGVAGAPLLDRESRVIGVMLVGGAGVIGYALPAEHLNKLLRDHARHGAAHAAWLGLGMTMGTSTPEIRSLREGSPAKLAGLRPGDVILAIGERKVEDYQDVIDACYALTAGEAVRFRLLRGLDDLELEVNPVLRKR